MTDQRAEGALLASVTAAHGAPTCDPAGRPLSIYVCSFHEGWIDGYDSAEVEGDRLRAALFLACRDAFSDDTDHMVARYLIRAMEWLEAERVDPEGPTLSRPAVTAEQPAVDATRSGPERTTP